MVVTHDSGLGGVRGGARIMLDSPDLAGTGLRVERYDDRGAQNHSGPGDWHGTCANSNKDCFSFDGCSTVVLVGFTCPAMVAVTRPPPLCMDRAPVDWIHRDAR